MPFLFGWFRCTFRGRPRNPPRGRGMGADKICSCPIRASGIRKQLTMPTVGLVCKAPRTRKAGIPPSRARIPLLCFAAIVGRVAHRCFDVRGKGEGFSEKSGHSTLPLARRTHHPFAVPCFGSQEHRPWDRSSRGDIIGATSSFGQKRSHAGQKSACAPSSLRELPEFGASE